MVRPPVAVSTLAPPVSAPVAAGERVAVLDGIRGVAVLCILLINIDALSGYAFTPASAHTILRDETADAITWFLLATLVEAKFYSLFSFLFGVGFAVFVQRAAARGADPTGLFKRRLIGLLLIGLVHTLLIWFGDILVTYALLGFVLVPFLRRSDRAVLRWAAAMLAAPIALYALLFAVAGQPAQPAAGGTEELPAVLASAAQSFAHGTYWQILAGNVIFTVANIVRRLLLMFFPRVVGMFLLGFYAGRNNLFSRLDEHRRLATNTFVAGLAIGLPLSVVAWGLGDHAVGPPTMAGLIDTVIKSIAVPLQALGYAAGLWLLFSRAPRVMKPLVLVGRMALSNYLMHSVAGVVIFYGIGFGLFGRVSLTPAVLGALGFFIVQIFLSRWWLQRAQFGPAEWLWRVFTYRRLIPLFKTP
jgi:uncharacterized protein